MTNKTPDKSRIVGQENSGSDLSGDTNSPQVAGGGISKREDGVDVLGNE